PCARRMAAIRSRFSAAAILLREDSRSCPRYNGEPHLKGQIMSANIDAFRALHASGCFVIPNPWDRGSAIYLQSLGFKSLATTSAGFAWSNGHADNGVTVDQVVAHLKEITSAVALPVNADFEGGFAREPAGVAANVMRAVAAGVAG